MLHAFVAEPPCAVCGRPAAHVELVAPASQPADLHRWSPQQRDAYNAARRCHDDQQWWLVFSGIVAGNGSGRPVDPAEAQRIADAFTRPYRYAAVTSAGFYDDAGFCGQCDAPYCYHHWNVSSTGYGRCPQGHGKSLDPHWWPDDL
ncbi:hypothetical protein [Micromonospora sp. WMMD964]|uniref:hypothetical protein n=1 Tax=Micromonospora sp. WMMD964 TaxID=3016091 RepID=UPI002499FEC2|nr:hypothetical protein [Micromonospora sp. WMMD964]WFF00206.1 hypothetical protein O7616_25430 [Micromonospora sp. WMMD964]